ncbi:hypothetical protein HAX54_048800 [Datura stramonium]|uniref:Uncharacterized protein n=1 Tax=Datura stramonium TaxID=4076 RepID=A0ABS8WLV2_DATST|nr:hypothetical protein [Datura stramonium]
MYSVTIAVKLTGEAITGLEKEEGDCKMVVCRRGRSFARTRERKARSTKNGPKIEHVYDGKVTTHVRTCPPLAALEIMKGKNGANKVDDIQSKKRMSSRKLGRFLKEQRGRLYIVRRCVVMLLCWHD